MHDLDVFTTLGPAFLLGIFDAWPGFVPRADRAQWVVAQRGGAATKIR